VGETREKLGQGTEGKFGVEKRGREMEKKGRGSTLSENLKLAYQQDSQLHEPGKKGLHVNAV
jgi:translation initiation factor IF-3